jgi:hypothetical protein
MQNVQNVSSEEELLQLFNEGKISEAEYQDLLGTLKKPAKTHAAGTDQDRPQPIRTSGLAIASLVFSLVGPLGSLPAIICGHLALRKIKKEPSMRGYGLGLAGLIIGYVVLGLSIAIFVPFIVPRLARVDVTELKHFRLDSTEGLITQSNVQIDRQISSDGNGSLRIAATEPTTIRLFETGDIDVENARLIYQARVRTENAEGPVYLEMWCHFPGKGEFFSRGLANPLTGTTSWTTQQITFRLKKGENPDNVKLNIVVDGKGTVWVDDIWLSAPALK